MAEKRKPGFAPAPDPSVFYRVRDRHDKDAPGYVWGENLTLEEAEKLKERVCASLKSKTARYEPMSVAYPPGSAPQAVAAPRPAPRAVTIPPRAQPPISPERLEQLRGERQKDPRLEQMRQHALGVASGTAQAAQVRADKIAAEKKAAESAAALAADASDDADDLTDGELSDLLGGVDAEPTDDEIAAEAARVAEEDSEAALEGAPE
jgi:hypothetical protein